MPPRKKSRKCRVPTDSAADVFTAECASQVAASTEHSPKPEPSGTARRALRGRRGGLKDMPNMPLDILIEIFSCMHPRDLLNLARTSKDFRTFLMSRNSAPFWKAARQQVEGLPECPSFLSEPQYSNLLFFSQCHNCLKANIQAITWEVYARYCQSCKDQLLFQEITPECDFIKEVKRETQVQGFAFTVIHLTPQRRYALHDQRFLFKPELERLRGQWAKLTDAEDKIRFAQAQADTVKERVTPITALKRWKVTQSDVRSAELEAIRKGRLQSILKRLEEEGWADELAKMDIHDNYRLEANKVVRKAQKLTNNGWRTIREELLEFMESVRTGRLARERAKVLQDRFEILYAVVSDYESAQPSERRSATSELQAKFADLATMPQFKALVEAPIETEVTVRDFVHLQSSIPSLKAEWLEARKTELLSQAEGLPEVASPLLLAMVAFKCISCARADLRWPNILAHKCTRDRRYGWSPYTSQMALRSVCMPKGEDLPWRGSELTFCKDDVQVRRSVITACGLDPDTATHEDMDQREARLVCTACSPDILVACKAAYDWKQAITHKRSGFKSMPSSNLECQGSWKLLDPQLTARVLECEQTLTPLNASYSPLLPWTGPMKCCAHCRHSTQNDMVAHCKDRHAVETPQLGEDYYDHPDSRKRTPVVRIYPKKIEAGRARLLEIGYGLLDTGVVYSASLFE
ncbi:hypothetical protein BC628DRAFT_1498125 [Trametes gibbosa]|nr:hypothetical protein BC628DRAFT_1498125 [Trametes gibbosa]